MAGAKGREKEVSMDHIRKAAIPDEEFRSSLEGTGEPWQVWGTRRVGTSEHLTSCFLAMSLS